jgi:hypothetical protein
MQVTVTRLVRDEGTIAIFEGTVDDGRRLIRFAADHRPAKAMLAAMIHTSPDGDSAWTEPIPATVEPYQVLASAPVCDFTIVNHTAPHAQDTNTSCPACFTPGEDKGD